MSPLVPRLAPLILLVATVMAPAQRPRARLDAIAFMQGCWTGLAANGAVIEERYTPPADNLIIGMTRYVKNGRVVDFEFTTLEYRDSTIILVPRPKGQRSDEFPLKEIRDGYAVWENPAHDFPQRIIYRRSAPRELTARIEGKTARGDQGTDWVMHPCG